MPASARKASVKKSPQRLNTPVSIPVDVPSTVNEIQDLELILVQTSDEIRIWNELMIEDVIRRPTG